MQRRPARRRRSCRRCPRGASRGCSWPGRSRSGPAVRYPNSGRSIGFPERSRRRDPARHRSRDCGCSGSALVGRGDRLLQRVVFGTGVDQGQELRPRAAGRRSGRCRRGRCGWRAGLRAARGCRRRPGARGDRVGRVHAGARPHLAAVGHAGVVETPTWTLTPASGRPRSSTSLPWTMPAGRRSGRWRSARPGRRSPASRRRAWPRPRGAAGGAVAAIVPGEAEARGRSRRPGIGPPRRPGAGWGRASRRAAPRPGRRIGRRARWSPWRAVGSVAADRRRLVVDHVDRGPGDRLAGWVGRPARDGDRSRRANRHRRRRIFFAGRRGLLVVPPGDLRGAAATDFARPRPATASRPPARAPIPMADNPTTISPTAAPSSASP